MFTQTLQIKTEMRRLQSDLIWCFILFGYADINSDELSSTVHLEDVVINPSNIINNF